MAKRETYAKTARETGESMYEGVFDVLLTGVAIVVPLVVAIYVLATAIEFIAGALTPMVAVLEWVGAVEFVRSLWVAGVLIDLGIYGAVFDVVSEIVAVAILLASVAVVGTLAHVRYGERIVVAIDAALAKVPGIGTVYRSFRRVGDAMLESDAENFEDVKAVEYPREGSYILGFETAHSPEPIAEAVGEEDLVALFLPFAPNPVMGGYLTHIPESRVYDVDMTIEEGIRTIITSGIANGDDDSEFAVGDIPGVQSEDGPAKAG